MNKKKKKINKLLLIALALSIFILTLAFAFLSQSSGIAHHVSEDLKISFDYPKAWYIDDRDYAILLTNYYTTQNRNDKPSGKQIELYIDNFNIGCKSTIEENLKDPGCGEGGPEVPFNEIISKETKKLPGGTYYKYVVRFPSGDQLTYRLLINENRVLKISKEPDPSQYEEEFEEIINSIKFQ